MRYSKLIPATLMILLMAAAVQAEVVAGRWEKMAALAPGSAVIVSIVGGERLECAFNKVEPEEILVNELNGKERRLAKVAILKIESAAVVRDRLRNGILLGTLIGAGGGIASMAVYGNSVTEGPVAWGDEDAASYLFGGALVGGGIGALAGALIDGSVKHREVFYRAR